ncbi:MAG: rRNA maturation RNase YbeY [Gammaproteobacteria bacterium]
MSVAVEISISEGLRSGDSDSRASESSDYCQGRQVVGQCGSDCRGDVPEPALLQAWATAAYLKTNPAIVSMRVTTSEEIQQLNKQYRNKDKATNVLSFPMQSPEEVGVCLLGDIVLCAAVINSEAKQQAKAESAHWAHMVVHGMLHLQDFDHVKTEEAEEMEQLETKILSQLGFDDPYSNTVSN